MPMGQPGKTGLLNTQGKNIRHAEEILKLLEAVQLPKKIAIMHIRAHQKANSELEGNELADRVAKEAVRRGKNGRSFTCRWKNFL